MSWSKDNAPDFRTMLEDLVALATKTTKAETPTSSGNTGNGNTISQSSTKDSVLETITITCTTGGPNAIFSVVGGTTGALTDANINELYSDSVIGFVISGGSTDFIIGDSFNIVISSESSKWTIDRYDHTPGNEYEVIMHGEGYTGLEEIYIGIRTYESGSVRGWDVNSFTAYDGAKDFFNQPGRYPKTCFVATTDTNIQTWFHVSPQRIMANLLSGTNYFPLYLGWIDTYATPSQYLYPICVGCSNTSRTSYINGGNAFWHGTGSGNASFVAVLDTAYWIPNAAQDTIQNYPDTSNFSTVELTECDDGTVPFFESVLSGTTGEVPRVMGEYEGVTIPATLQTTLTVEDIIITDDKAYIVMQNVSLTGNLALFELDGDV